MPAILATLAAVGLSLLLVIGGAFDASGWIAALGATAVALTGYRLAVRPWMNRWGTRRAVLPTPFPGDDLVAADVVTTRAVAVRARASELWPWLVQAGYRRAGWYGDDVIERLLGLAHYVEGERSADHIIPELQDVRVGDPVLIAPRSGFYVAAVDAERHLVLRADPTLGHPDGGPLLDATWAFTLVPDGDVTWLTVRGRYRLDRAPRWLWVAYLWAAEPLHFLMERRLLRGLQRRAQALHSGALPRALA